MSEQSPEQPVGVAETDPVVRRLREFVSAAIAVVIILGTVVMLIQAFNYLGSPQEFERVKDLLLFINPLLGVVVGYYFSRATSEPRAESAETAAKSAIATAQQEAEARNRAEIQAEEAGIEAEEARGEAEEAVSTLREVSLAAEKVMAQTPMPKTLMTEEGGRIVDDPLWELQMALTRARHLIE